MLQNKLLSHNKEIINNKPIKALIYLVHTPGLGNAIIYLALL